MEVGLRKGMSEEGVELAGFLLRARTREIYPAMTLRVPGYRRDGRSFYSVTCVRQDSH